MKMDEQELQMLAYQAEQLQAIIEKLNAQLLDVNTTIEALSGLSKMNTGEKVLFPIANGIFLQGTIEDTKRLRINVGSDVVVEKGVDDAITMMQKQYDEITDYKKQLEQQFNELLMRVQG